MRQVLQFIKNALTLQSRHWPARTEKSLIVNAPTWFSYVFALIRPLLNQRQREKVRERGAAGREGGRQTAGPPPR